MAVRPRNRFEVFKRDGFQCQYCGRRVPDVTLEVDHILPKVEGGKDAMSNLITSCFECNRGKGPVRLSEGAPSLNYRKMAADARERKRQVLAYYEAEKAGARQVSDMVEDLADHWQRSTGLACTMSYRARLHTFVGKLGPERVREAVNLTAAKGGWLRNPFGYFCAICWKWVREEGGSGALATD